MSELATIPKPERAPIAMHERGVNLSTFDEMARFCQAVANSGLAPKGLQTPEAIMVAIQHGLEIGLAPMQALQSIALINGRPSVWGDAALALISSRKDCVDIQESFTDEKATCTVQRKGRTAVTREFSVADAKRAGLWGKAGPWQQYPTRMLQMRARSWALRDSFPDALRGVGIVEEVRDIQPREEKAVERARLILPDETTEAAQ